MENTNGVKKLIVELPEHSMVNENIILELDSLFEAVLPGVLKKSVTDIFFSYLIHTDPEEYKPELQDIARDFYALIEFLEVAEMYERKDDPI